MNFKTNCASERFRLGFWSGVWSPFWPGNALPIVHRLLVKLAARDIVNFVPDCAPKRIRSRVLAANYAPLQLSL
jgi:hypothetical protein